MKPYKCSFCCNKQADHGYKLEFHTASMELIEQNMVCKKCWDHTMAHLIRSKGKSRLIATGRIKKNETKALIVGHHKVYEQVKLF